MNRNLSGIYFREKQNGHWENVCFEDLSEKSQDKILKKASPIFVRNLAKTLAKDLKALGDKFDIICD